MKLQRIKAVAKKEFLHVVRDPRSLIMGLALPMLLLFMFGYALTLDVDNVPLAVWDQDNSPASRELVSRFSGSRYFSLVSRTGRYADLERAIDTRRALIALVIPTGFADRLAAGETVPVQAIIDGSDSNTATIALGYAGNIVGGFSRALTVKQLLRRGSDPPRPPIDLVPRVWYNPDLESRIAIIPGLIAVIMMVIAALLTSLTVAREWETGTMEQLIATPLTGFELIVGKLAPYFCIGLFDMALAMLVGRFVFHVPMRGDRPLLLALAILFLLVALSLGMLISIVGKSQFVASQFALMATLLPAFLLSGFVFRIANMPPLLQAFTHVIPARYFVTILRGIYLKGVGLRVLAGEVAFLGLFGLLVFLVAVRKFRKRIL
ncbi:ABC transporter permease [Geobacter argillaceus]|uniref:ABC-2 type transport system permease protein n=1 Tax=Geobacter argillaceus TaxID=345631 RepID=A0A562V7I4_9BACT|nr:ABC transporter permease [Geobacter argillaceus]TWJ13869.1 ABC-2 type transport system permease protein [Geobacter argillaceus]